MIAVLNRLRGLGVSERTIRLERDWSILLQASDPDALPQWIRDKNLGLEDPEKTRLYLACDQCVGWDPRDPRVDQLIDDLETWEIERDGNSSRPEHPTPLFSLVLRESPAWHRILDTLARRAEGRRTTMPDS
ncbi:hypothetical protein [Nocardia coffeae]|uniref:hypothetical protein n=1 Tax=Nocardia coffeae TaxID=2873381 RepID=UPI001F1B1515|nr:hypothetical protein [Nocardia coffeae]